jgi:hypothetical protein
VTRGDRLGSIFRRPLVVVDGPGRDRAVRIAVDIALSSRGRIGLLGLVRDPSRWVSMSTVSVSVVMDGLEAEATRLVDEAELFVPPEVPVTKLLVRGRIAEALGRLAVDGSWDVLVVSQGSCVARCRRRRASELRLSVPGSLPVLVAPRGS